MKADKKYLDLFEPASGIREEIAALALLIKDTDASVIAFALFRGAANREMAMQTLKEHLDIPVAEFTLSSRQKNAINFLQEAPFQERGCIFFVGLEDALPEAAGYLNLQREAFAEVPHAVVFWVTEYGLRELANRAPDFWSWRSGVFDCRSEAQMPFAAMEDLALLPLPFSDQGDVERRISLYEELLQEYNQQENPDTHFIAGLHEKLVTAYSSIDRVQEAKIHAEQVMVFIQQIDDRRLEISLLQFLGIMELYQGLLDDAEFKFHQVKKIIESWGDDAGLFTVFRLLGIVAEKRKKLEEAELWCHKALQIAQHMGNEPYIAAAYHQMGIIAHKQNEPEQAESWFLKALEIYNRFGLKKDVAIAYQSLGVEAEQRNKLEEAESWYQKALEISERLGEGLAVVFHYAHLGKLAQKREQFQEAEKYYHKALDISERLYQPWARLLPLEGLGVLYLEEQQLDKSLKYFSRALPLAITSIKYKIKPENILLRLSFLLKNMGKERFKKAWQQTNQDPELSFDKLKGMIEEIETK